MGRTRLAMAILPEHAMAYINSTSVTEHFDMTTQD